jgi:hypothetical protein
MLELLLIFFGLTDFSGSDLIQKPKPKPLPAPLPPPE